MGGRMGLAAASGSKCLSPCCCGNAGCAGSTRRLHLPGARRLQAPAGGQRLPSGSFFRPGPARSPVQRAALAHVKLVGLLRDIHLLPALGEQLGWWMDGSGAARFVRGRPCMQPPCNRMHGSTPVSRMRFGTRPTCPSSHRRSPGASGCCCLGCCTPRMGICRRGACALGASSRAGRCLLALREPRGPAMPAAGGAAAMPAAGGAGAAAGACGASAAEEGPAGGCSPARARAPLLRPLRRRACGACGPERSARIPTECCVRLVADSMLLFPGGGRPVVDGARRVAESHRADLDVHRKLSRRL
jgi:hypothetical protein